jgi:hypothetical protein
MKEVSGEGKNSLEKEFHELKELYKKLCDEINEDSYVLDESIRAEWLGSINELVDSIEEYAPNIASANEEKWVREAALKLGILYNSIMSPGERRRRIWKEIEMALPKEVLTSTPRRKITWEDVERHAYYLGESRKIRLLNRLIEDPENFQKFLQLFPNEPENIDSDWYSACAYFSSDILERKIEFPGEVTYDLYSCLEEVWFENVKEIRAYQIWQDNGNEWKPEESQREIDYFLASEKIASNLVDVSLKSPPQQFEALEVYLKQKYLTNSGDFDSSKSHHLIARKASRLWGKIGVAEELENWLSAEKYIENFYGNIVCAIKDGNTDSLKKVKEAIQSISDPNYKYIINCFEVAIVIYFIKAEDLEDVKI